MCTFQLIILIGKLGITMNVRSEMLYHYIQVFNEIFLSTGRQFLPEEILKSLLRYPLIQGGHYWIYFNTVWCGYRVFRPTIFWYKNC